ncbi:shikimate kinase [Psychromonas sp. KJ10-10]|uniref:shikimate kinase n=1 Tax=Psychromonas sp. KJ10-10 TaxID=3391823 RepID=UPI0039B5AEA4
MKRINVIGTSGSGKSTFSQKLALKLNYPYLEMDNMFWKANWVESSNEEFLLS